MELFNAMAREGFERVRFICDSETGLRMLIVIHDRTLGPALGGIRFFDYGSEKEMLTDCMRLAKGMTYKNAIIRRLSHGRLSYGGGKSVIWGNSETDKTTPLLLAAAEAINELGGEYFGGADMGMTVNDIEIMGRKTRFLAGRQETHFQGRSRGSGNPAPVTALGVFQGIRASMKAVFGTDFLYSRKFAIQGLGSVGMELLEYLAVRAGAANITVTDTNRDRLTEAEKKYPDIKVIEPEDHSQIFEEKCDVLVPCAVGGIINDDTIPLLQCRIVAGAANNQLLEPRHGEELRARGILYAPDYVINAGGAINVETEMESGGYDHDKARERTERIGPLLTEIFTEAKRRGTTPEKITDEMAEKEIQKAKN